MDEQQTSSQPVEEAKPVDEQTTTETSSDSQQTVQETNTGTSEKAPETSNEVPEVNRVAERARKAEKELQEARTKLEAYERSQAEQTRDPQVEMVKKQLKDLGFITIEDQQQELQRRDQDAQVEKQLTQLESQYTGADGRPKFDRQEVIEFALNRNIGDLETAYEKMHNKELIDWHVKQAMTANKGVKTEASDGSGSSQAGTTNSDLREAIRRNPSDQASLMTLIKRNLPRFPES